MSADHSSTSSDSNSNNLFVPFISLPPQAVTVGGSSIERPGVSHSSATDTVSGTVNFTDINASAIPTVTATFATFTLQNAQQSDITATLTAQQLAAIAAVEVPISVVPATGNNNNGSATLTYSMADGAFDFLAANETLTLIYSVTVNDGRGGVVSSPFSVTITGTNDTPALAADTAPHAITKLGTGNSTPDIATGSLTFTDVDLSDTHSVASSLVSATWSNGALPSGLNGTLAAALATSIAKDSSSGATGNVSFTFSAADSVLGFLSVGQTLTVTYNVTVDDGHGGSSTQPVTVIITGTNNAPTIVAGSTTATGAIGEIAATTGSTTSDHASGSIAFADVNLSDTHTVSQAAPTFAWSGGTLSAGQIAALTSASTLELIKTDSTGTGSGSVAWNYNAQDKNFDFLAAGQTLTVTYAVTVDDGHGGSAVQNVVVTVTGTDDAAVITGTDTQNLTETNAILTTGGALSVSDVDNAATFIAQSGVEGSGGFGKFTINAAGDWHYTTDTAHNEFVGGTTYTDTLTVSSADGTTHVLTVNILGTNDAAVITGTDTQNLTETNAILTTGGALSVSDVDSAATFIAQTGVEGSGGFGKFTINAAGDWHYTTDTAHNEFVGGTTYTDTLTVSSADGTTHVLTVNILGTNDAAVITGTDTQNLTETNAILTTGGALSVSDVDSAATFIAQSGVEGSGGFGKFTINAAGDWHYTTDTAHNEFVGGTTYTDTLTVSSADGTTHVLTVNILGTNDAAVITGTSSGSVEIADDGPGSGQLTDTGTLTDTDVDNPNNSFTAVTTATASTGGYGSFTMTAAGVWTYKLTNSPNLGEHQHVTDTFTVHTVDGTAKVVTVTINDDDPVIGPAGVAGSEINLGLAAAPPDTGSLVTVTVADLPSGWSLTGGVQVDDHTWTIQTSDVQSLTVTSSSASLGAVMLEVSESWTKPDGTTASALVADNVESYAVGSPIFALTANDYLTGSSGSDLFVFAQPISHDVIYSFNSASDKIDLVGFSGFADFNDVAAHLSDDGAGNTVLTLASDETITLHGVNSASLSAGNFEFNQQTVLENSADMIIGNGAKLPLSGMIENTGVIELNSTGGETDLQLIKRRNASRWWPDRVVGQRREHHFWNQLQRHVEQRRQHDFWSRPIGQRQSSDDKRRHYQCYRHPCS